MLENGTMIDLKVNKGVLPDGVQRKVLPDGTELARAEVLGEDETLLRLRFANGEETGLLKADKLFYRVVSPKTEPKPAATQTAESKADSTASTPIDQMEMVEADEAPPEVVPDEEAVAEEAVAEEAEAEEVVAEEAVAEPASAVAGEITVTDLPGEKPAEAAPEAPVAMPPTEAQSEPKVFSETVTQLEAMLKEKDGRIERLKLDVEKYFSIAEEHSQQAGLLRDELKRTKAEFEQAKSRLEAIPAEIEIIRKKATEELIGAEAKAHLRIREMEAENSDVRRQRDASHSKLCAIYAEGRFPSDELRMEVNQLKQELAKVGFERDQAKAEANKAKVEAEAAKKVVEKPPAPQPAPKPAAPPTPPKKKGWFK